MKNFTACIGIGFATKFQGNSAEEVEDYIRNVMSNSDFNQMVVSGMDNGEIEIEVREDEDDRDISIYDYDDIIIDVEEDEIIVYKEEERSL
jgi:hypothetical protein